MNNTRTEFEHWHYRIDDTDICHLTIDTAGKSTNILTLEVLEELHRLVDQFSASPFKAMIIRSAKANGFIAGANINEFTTISTREEALRLIERGQSAFTAIENLPFPTLCLIHGFCLGGGLELALACTYRIAADAPSTKIGLPEVKLGIHPGFGGTVRLSRLIGGPAALEVMLTGRTLSARKASKMGIIHHAVPKRLLSSSGLQLINSPPTKKRGYWPKVSALAPIRALTTAVAGKKLAAKVKKEHYPAPFAILDLWEKHGGTKDMMSQEAYSIADLISGPTAKNLIRVFFLQERLKSLPADKNFRPAHVHVVGAGVMGSDIAAWCAFKGFKVSVQDNSHEILARSYQRASDLFRRKLKVPHLIKGAQDRFMPDIEGKMVGKADVVIEAVFEDVRVKQELYSRLLPRMRPEAILASNTSSIPLETLAADLDHPQRLIGLHFFNPVAKMMLVEVVRTSFSDDSTIAKAIQFTKRIGKLPLPVKSSPGFLVNRILMPYLHEAATMEAEGIPAAAIDYAAEQFGMPVGPIELIDLVGLDICLSVGKFMTDDPALMMPPGLQELVDSGRLGRKTNAGYYDYKDGRPVKPKADPSNAPPEVLAQRLILRLINEGVACLREEVVSDADMLDAGMIFGTGFAPFRGGVIHYLRDRRGKELLSELRHLHRKFGQRFTPDPGWETLDELQPEHSS